MPGTIQVSVLDFNGPSTSSSSSIFLKVSMGRREYQTEDNGEFSFPLTSLRDNLVIVLQDANGSQISHKGIGTILIIEKGIWDDLFNLEGGGIVHMRLQFILSKEERDRIREVRESAVKKKRDSGTFGRSQSLSSMHSEVSDSQAFAIHNKATVIGDSAVLLGKDDNKETSRPLLQPNATDRSEETPSTSSVKILDTHSSSNHISLQKSSSTTDLSEPFPSIEEKIVSADLKHDPHENYSSNGNKVVQGSEVHGDVQVGTTLQKEASPILGSAKQVLAAKIKPVFVTMDKSWSNKPKKRESLEIIRGIRNRISAFESSPSQDTRTPAKPPPEKLQSNKVVIKIPPNDQDPKDATLPSESSSKILKNPFPPKHLPPNPIKSTKTGDHNGSRKTSLSTLELEPILESKESKTLFTEDIFENDTEEPSISAAEFSGPILVETEKIYKRCDDQDSAVRLITHDGYGKRLINSHDDDSPGSVSCSEKEGNLYESVLYANDMRRLCLTTGGKEVMDLLEGLNREEKSLFFTSEDERKNVQALMHNYKVLVAKVIKEKSGAETEVKSEKKTADQICKKSDSESSGHDSYDGPFGQVIKIAVIVGFGLLLLLTTQSEANKKSKRRETDNFSTTRYRKNQERMADEEW